ncbi:MAG: hypothetical protein ACUVQ8_03110 [Nitrososphaeria archaeon]
MALVRENGGFYEISNEVKVDVMRDYLRVDTMLLPRFVVYAIIFLPVCLEEPVATALLMLLSLMASILWYEAFKAWKPLGSIRYR